MRWVSAALVAVALLPGLARAGEFPKITAPDPKG